MTTTSQINDAALAKAIALVHDELIPEKLLAKRWHCSVKFLQKHRQEVGDGTHISHRKIGRMVRYAMSDVLAYEARRTRTSTSDGGAIND